jgi:hypothetical protein
MPKCEHGLTSKECYVCASPEYAEQAEKQEPSLWFAIGKDGRVKYTTDSDRALKWKQAGSYRLVRDYYTSPVHAIEQAEKQEPIECMCGICKLGEREWVGLTDKEVTSIIREWHWMPYELCKVIEAKLKEKNCSAANNS